MIRKSLYLFFLTLSCVLFAQIPANYYTGTSGQSGEQLKTTLYNIIKGHTTYPYTSSSTDVWDILKEADRDPNNTNNVIGIYSGFSMNAAAEYNSGSGWNREHVWAKSRGDFGTSQGAGTDVHHLRAADISTNSARSNRTFAESANQQYIDGSGSYSGPTGSFTSSSEFVWKPRPEVRGDVARMIFYMATRYEGVGGEPDLELTDLILSNTDKSPLHGRLTDLLLWHQQDPVDDSERNRNDIIYSYQNNRNPFIDHPEFVALIWGGTTSNAPNFTSTAEISGTVATPYSYSITASGGNGSLSITAPVKPTWSSILDNGDGTATLSGTPNASGSFSVQLVVSDGIDNDTQSFTINVNSSGGTGSATELFFSEYIEGSSYNKAIEIANFTGSESNLSSYEIKKQTNGSGSWSSGLPLSGSLSNGGVYVVAHSSASSSITSEANYTGGNSELNFNGNDALGLFKDGVLIDALGIFNSAATFGQNVTLVRNSDVISPNIDYTISEWTSHSSNTFNYLGTHEMSGGATGNEGPSVYITSPSNGAGFTEGDLVSISATASDSDGTISSVEFFANGSSIGVDTNAPFNASFTIGVGNYSLSAVALDNESASTTSSIVIVTGEASSFGETVISYDDFESGWGSFRDGGSDAYRYTGGTYAYEGSSAGGIQDNSGAFSSFYSKDGFDATPYDQIEVEFYFYPRSMENGEDFWLRFYDGSTWHTVATWARGTDFSNNNFYVTTVTIASTEYNFSGNAKLRFQCDASANADDVYIDEITVIGVSNGSGRRSPKNDLITELVKPGFEEETLTEVELKVFPNPVSDRVNIQFESEEDEQVLIRITDLQGRVLQSYVFDSKVGLNEHSLDMTKHDNGFYLIQISKGDETITRQVIK